MKADSTLAGQHYQHHERQEMFTVITYITQGVLTEQLL